MQRRKNMRAQTEKKMINRNRSGNDKMIVSGVIKRYYKHIQGLMKNINTMRRKNRNYKKRTK